MSTSNCKVDAADQRINHVWGWLRAHSGASLVSVRSVQSMRMLKLSGEMFTDHQLPLQNNMHAYMQFSNGSKFLLKTQT